MRLFKALSIRWTIGRRIALAFTAMGMIVLTLAATTMAGLNRAGDLVAKSFDESVVTTNFVRATADDFSRMRSEFALSGRAKSGPVALLERSLRYDLATTLEKLPTPAMKEAGEAILAAASQWMEKALAMEAKGGGGSPGDKAEINEIGHRIDEKIESMINIVGEAAYNYRLDASAMVARDLVGAVSLAGAAVVMLTATALLLFRGITGPLQGVVGFAQDIAHGQLDGMEPKERDDEIGLLIRAMRSMRAELRTMMQEQVVLRESSQARIAEALDSSRDGIILADGRGTIQIANLQALEFLGWTAPTRPTGTSIDDLRKDLAKRRGQLALIDTADLADGACTGETLLSDGRRIQNSRSRTSEGGFVGLYADITTLADQKANLDAALANMAQGLCVFDAGSRIKLANRNFYTVLGIDPDRAPPTTPHDIIVDLCVELGEEQQGDPVRLKRHVGLLLARQRRCQRFLPFHNDRILAVTLEPMPDGGWLAMVEDVTERRRAEDRIGYLASHDALTGLPNRILLAKRVDEAVNRIRPGVGFAMLCIDLDRFKEVNDTLGHAVGDHLLSTVAERLAGCVGRHGTVARLGGDEFAVLQTGVGTREDVEALAQRILESLGDAFDVDGHTIWIGASIGIALAPQHGLDYGDLLKNADVALRSSKDQGRGLATVFAPHMNQVLTARRILQTELKQAIAGGEFVLAYQPLLDLASLGICSFEALVRWNHPSRGLVMPGEFIAAAEDMGLIDAIGAWVLEQACRQATTWPDTITVAVNVSVVQLRDGGFAQAVKRLLGETGLAPHRLELEVTESVFMSNNVTAMANLDALKQHGVRFAIDDFGTGYSSLSYLRRFAFDKIKIDRSFLTNMLESEETEQIVRTIIGLGKNLALTVIAEGVETPKQMQRLQQLGCDQIQGYLIGKPMSADLIQDALERHGAAGVVPKAAERVRRPARRRA